MCILVIGHENSSRRKYCFKRKEKLNVRHKYSFHCVFSNFFHDMSFVILNIHAAFALPNGHFVMMYKNKFYQVEKNRKRVAKGFPVKLHEWIQCTPK